LTSKRLIFILGLKRRTMDDGHKIEGNRQKAEDNEQQARGKRQKTKGKRE
jgi:uncharacterized protein YjbJ (UPF0337 family)